MIAASPLHVILFLTACLAGLALACSLLYLFLCAVGLLVEAIRR